MNELFDLSMKTKRKWWKVHANAMHLIWSKAMYEFEL